MCGAYPQIASRGPLTGPEPVRHVTAGTFPDNADRVRDCGSGLPVHFQLSKGSYSPVGVNLGVKCPTGPAQHPAKWPVLISNPLEATPGIEPGIAVLQTAALPLG